MTDTTTIAVVGGGISGLSAAHALRRAAPHLDIVLLEGARLGGKIHTEQGGGFVVEAGPDSFLSSKPAALALCRTLGLENELQGTTEATRRTFVMRDGRLHLMPEGLTGLVPSRLEPLMDSAILSPEGKKRMAREPAIPAAPARPDETLAAFVTRRFGAEVYERLIEPLMAGIYAGDGRKLSLEATFPQLRRLEEEHGSVLRGMAAASRSSADSSGPRRLPAFLTPRSGMGRLIEALRRALQSVRILEDTPVRHIRASRHGYDVMLRGGHSVHADSVILATPAFAASNLLEGLDADLSTALASIRYVATATVSVAYASRDVPHPLDGHGYVVPRCEGRPILACTWTSSKFANRAPHGFTLLRAFIGRDGMEDALERNDAELFALVREELRVVLGITAPPRKVWIYRWPRAMPQYEPGHVQMVRRLDETLSEHPGLYLAGSAYRGVGIPDCIQSGESAATAALACLGMTSRA